MMSPTTKTPNVNMIANIITANKIPDIALIMLDLLFI